MTDSKSHPIRSSVISGLILAGVISLFSLTPGGWAFAWNILKMVWNWLIGDQPVRGWVLVLLIACAAAVLVILVLIAWSWITGSKDLPMDWKAHTEDEFFGLKWRWRYGKSGIYGVVCFCPVCDQQLYPQNRSSFRVVDRIGFTCDHCGRDLGEFDMNWDTLQDKVTRSVQRKIRTGEWSKSNV
jgi:hypothetical protein